MQRVALRMVPAGFAVLALTAAACTKPGADTGEATPRDPWTPDSGLTASDPPATHGWDYVLFAPIGDTVTWLIAETGEAVHKWESDRTPGESVYLLDDGTLMRTGTVGSDTFQGGGLGGSVHQLDWNGDVLWEFTYATSTVHQHHDIAVMPNGNVLMLAWEAFTEEELLQAGRDPSLVKPLGGWMEQVVEVDPRTNEIVWQWRVMDHVAQDRSAAAANYVPDLADHPERIDIDFQVNPDLYDWLHANGLDYNADLDQIAISVHHHSEIWIVDRPTGALVYRWGNPAAWGAGTDADRALYFQHNVHWIAEGLDGEGDLLIFDNGDPVDRPWSRVVQITPPLQPDGTYLREGGPFGPTIPTWEYVAPDAGSFFATHISGAQRQPEGTTLICDGPPGHFFAVDSAGDEVWSYSYGGSTFRAERYPADHPGLAGRDLTGLGEFPVDDSDAPGPGPGPN